MTNESHEVVDKLDQLIAITTGMDARLRVVEAEVVGLKTEMADIKARVAKIEIAITTDLRVVEARLDEQRQTLNAMIPTHIAAVPPPRENGKKRAKAG